MIWKRKPKATAPVIDLAKLDERMRGFILDSQIPHGHEISELLGCSFISDEVAEREEEESDNRVEKIAYLIPLVYAYAHTLAEGLVIHQREMLPDDEDIPEEIWTQSNALFEKIAMATTLGALSQIVDMGLLEIIQKGKK
jgi:hypothetical protein